MSQRKTERTAEWAGDVGVVSEFAEAAFLLHHARVGNLVDFDHRTARCLSCAEIERECDCERMGGSAAVTIVQTAAVDELAVEVGRQGSKEQQKRSEL